jgi:hypothetical protein
VHRAPALRRGTAVLQRGVWECGYALAAYVCAASPTIAETLQYDDALALLLHNADVDSIVRQRSKLADFLAALATRAATRRTLDVYRRRFVRAYTQTKVAQHQR